MTGGSQRRWGLALPLLLLASACGEAPGERAPTTIQPPSPSTVAPGGPAATQPPHQAPNPSGVSKASSRWTPRTPAVIKTQGNHLKGSGSLYLRQHQNNPLEWYPWGPEALGRAKAENKPIFLSIGYASCHWCHVMEHEVFEKEAVATFMNANFVNIKVDREERPDLDKVYMDAVVAMTGRGGWPMTVFLTPELKPFKGGTYFPEDRFMRLARSVLRQFKTDRATIDAEGAKYARNISAGPMMFDAGAMSEDFLKGAPLRAMRNFDTQWGGFRQRTKFPTPSRWSFFLNHFRKWGDPALGKQVELTLRQMATGGIYDHVGGGFHRYSVERTWMIPHFEKMLYDNGQLIELYANAHVAFGQALFKDVAVDIMDFMMREMQDPQGGFYASYDADSGGEEGTFYVWTPKQLQAVAGEQDGKALAEILNVTAQGNFEHKTTVLSRGRRALDIIAAKLGRPVDELKGLWPKYRTKLREVRSKRVWPGLDKKIVTAWNGLAIAGFAKGYAITGEARYRQAAEKAAEYLWRVHRRSDGGVYRVSNAGKAEHVGVLDDYAFWADGLLALFQATGDQTHLTRAVALIEQANRRFEEPNGAWYLTEATAEAPLGRQIDTRDAVRPSGNARMLRALMQLAALQGSEKHFKRVKKTLNSYMGLLRSSVMSVGGWLDVGLMDLGPYYEVVIAGDPGSAATKALRAALQTRMPTWVVSVDVPAAGADEATQALLPPAFGKTARKGQPHAYVCVRGSCKKPTADVTEFTKQFMDGWTK